MIRDFQTYLDVEKNVSEHTKTAYIADIQEFARFLVEQQFVRQPDEIVSTQPETLRHYLAVLYKKDEEGHGEPENSVAAGFLQISDAHGKDRCESR